MGTSLALEEVEKMDIPKSKNAFRIARNSIGDIVSNKLGNTRAVSLAKYIDKIVFSQWQSSLAEQGIEVKI